MARLRPERHRQLRGYNATSTARKTIRSRRCRSTPSASAPSPGPPRASAPRSCTTAAISSSTERHDRPYTEDDRPNPRSVYAVSKLLGEWFAADAPRAYVLRVESLFGRAPDGPPAKGSVAGIVKTLLEGGEPTVFEDRTVSPTYVLDAARATRQLVERTRAAGLYHCVNSGHCTWLEFARELARQLGVEPRLKPVRMADVPLRAARPQYCALSNEKLAVDRHRDADVAGRTLKVVL